MFFDLDQAVAIHLIGIGGTGLSAIARLLLESGYRVSGSDRALSPLAHSLLVAGITVTIGHHANNVRGAGLVVRSSAIPDNNVEVLAARAAGIPVLKRDEFLGRLTAHRQTVAVAGTHGKTTTTAMIAWVLSELGLDPSYLIGGVSANLGTNAHAGLGQAFVIEADEYDRMFHGLKPHLAVVTNIEHDHPDCYPTPEDFYQAFSIFISGLQPQGTLLACGDDPGSSRLLAEARANGQIAQAYGIKAKDLAYRAENLAVNPAGGYTFDLRCDLPGGFELRPAARLQAPGEHNVLNALAALAVVHQLSLPVDKAGLALSKYQGTGRRFEVRGEADGVVVIDDYAHHPTKIRATLAAARVRYPGRHIWAVWQPHTYSRTRTLLAGFATAFENADELVVLDIYPAREAAPADHFSSRQVVAAMHHPRAHFIPDLLRTTSFLLSRLSRGDVLLVMSAGDADQICEYVLSALKERSASHA
ncbi:MAG TPA: UDP-N-acetylmuramate--L-alanine ligase [Anaerolineales bacterium]|nr:UDP-N-acetylmuramate--L-alanine ligase [Anaerolineales bacterium]